MKSAYSLILFVFLLLVVLSFKGYIRGSIRGSVTPAEAVSGVWAVSSKDTLKAAMSQGEFKILDAEAGSYRLIIDAVEPYKDVVKDGIQVNEGNSTDVGVIELEK